MDNLYEILRTLAWVSGALIYGMLVALFIDARAEAQKPRAYIFASLAAFLWYSGNVLVDLNLSVAGDKFYVFTNVATVIASVGLGLLPSGLLHAATVTRRKKTTTINLLIIAGYLPTVFLIPICYYILKLGRYEFFAHFRSSPFYLTLVGLWVAFAFAVAFRNAIVSRKKYKGRLSGASVVQNKIFQAGIILFSVVLVLMIASESVTGAGSASMVTRILRLITITLATGPGAFIIFYIYRYQYMDLKIRHKISTFAGIIAVILAHAFLVRPLTAHLTKIYELDFVLLEGFFVVLAVLVFEPLRRRVNLLIESTYATRAKTLAALQAKLAEFPPENIRARVNLLQTSLEELYGTPIRIELKDKNPDALFNWAIKTEAELHKRIINIKELPEELLAKANEERLNNFLILADENGCYGIVGLPKQNLGEQDREALVKIARTLAANIRSAMAIDKLITLEQKLSEAARLSSLGKLSATIAHEVKNPLSSIKTIANVLKNDLQNNEQASKDLEVIISEIERLAEVVENLLAVAKPTKAQTQGGEFGFDVIEMLQGLLAVLTPDAKRRGVKLTHELPPTAGVVKAYESPIRQAVFQILLNALELTEHGGAISLTLKSLTDAIEIIVKDTGPGLPSDSERIFDEFFTAKDGGTGLGLAIAKEIIEEAGGKIKAENRTDSKRGARFTIKLPADKRIAPIKAPQ